MAIRGFTSDIQENWFNGVVTAVLPDRLPDNAVSSAKNGQFYNVGPDKAVYGTRLGCELQNVTANASQFISQYYLKGTSNFHLLVDSAHNLKKLVSGSISTIAASFTTTNGDISWQTFNTRAYMVNGTDAKKTDGATVTNFGIRQPVSGDFSVSATSGATSIPTGVYDVEISFFNSSTNHEGPASDPKQVTLSAGQRIQVVLPSSGTIGDAQVDFVKIYLRQEATTNQFWLVVAGTDVAITGTNGWAPNTTVKIDSSQTQIDVFEILAPNVNDNFPPPSGATCIINHRDRMFVAKGSDIFWSKLNDPESFNLLDSTETIGEDDGQSITAFGILNDTVVVFKKSVIYYIDGDDPTTWVIRLKDKTVGSTNFRSVAAYKDNLYFMSLKGPQRWVSLGSDVDDITTQLIGPTFDADHIDPDDLSTTVVMLNPTKNYIGWAFTPVNESTNTVVTVFDLLLGRWMSEEWRMVDIRSAAVIEDATGRQWAFVSDYDGFIYKVGIGGNDGLPDGVSAIGMVTTSGATTLTDSTATWTTNQLIGKYVTVWSDVNGLRLSQRRRITANTATQLTVVSAWDANPVLGDHYNLAGILFDWQSGFRNGGIEFYRKRIEYVFTEMTTSSEGENVTVESYIDLDDTNPVMSRTFQLGDGAMFDEADFDEVDFVGAASVIKRIPIHRQGHSWLTRILHLATNEQIFLSRLGVQWLTKTKKIGTTGGD